MRAKSERMRQSPSILAWGLVGAGVAEFLLLRTGTRGLIHIPGLERFETPIRALAEIGRFAYYLAVVLLVVTLVSFGVERIRSRGARDLVLGASVVLFLLVALAGRADLVSADLVGWFSLAVVAGAVGLTWRGVRSIPVALFAFSSVAAGLSVLGQGDGGGLSGLTVDWLVISAEVLLVLAALSSPLVVGTRLTSASSIAGAVAATLFAGAFAGGGSTLSIIILWNIGVPGWLSWIAYSLAIGALTTSLWLAVTSGRLTTAIGLTLLVAGGVGVISTYQTGLVLAAILFLYASPGRGADMEARISDDHVLDKPEPVGVVGG